MPSLLAPSRFRGIAVFAGLLLTLAVAFAPREARAEVGVVLEWVAPGDDSTFGRAAEYDLRYSWKPRFPGGFNEATRWLSAPAPGPAGSIERVTITGLDEGRLYYFALKTRDSHNNWSACSNIASAYATLDAASPVFMLGLSSPIPSPARVSTRMALTLPRRSTVRVDALDVAGRRVRTLQKGELEAGPNDVVWDLQDDSGRPVRPGVYFVRARVAGEELQRRLIVVR